MKKFLSVKQTADELGLHANTVRKYANDGRLVVYRDANQRRKFHVKDIERFKGNWLHKEHESD
jgi:DNA-binding transcriptional MerR regulator